MNFFNAVLFIMYIYCPISVLSLQQQLFFILHYNERKANSFTDKYSVSYFPINVEVLM